MSVSQLTSYRELLTSGQHLGDPEKPRQSSASSGQKEVAEGLNLVQ